MRIVNFGRDEMLRTDFLFSCETIISMNSAKSCYRVILIEAAFIISLELWNRLDDSLVSE